MKTRDKIIELYYICGILEKMRGELLEELDNADEVLRHVRVLWGEEAKLFTIIEEEVWEI